MGSFDQPPVIIGHRGAAGLEPENTLPSFAAAVRLGVDAVELDVHVCEDQLVMIHDATLEQSTNGRGPVNEMNLEGLRKLDAGGGARIPTLAEVLEVLPEEVGLNVELKGEGTAPVLADWLPPAGPRQVVISSFDHQALADFQSLRADFPCAPLFGRWKPQALDIARSFGGGYINLGRKLATTARLKAINEAGLRALIYTVNDLKEARRLVADGAWGLFTDLPDRINRESLS